MSDNLKVCIVDDDSVYQYTMTVTLEQLSKVEKILLFSDGEEALDYLIENIDCQDNLPNVIFLDIDMPIMDGFQFMEEYVKIKPKVGKKITIYMVSSSIDDRDISKAKAISEISDYIIKPIKSNHLKDLIAQLENTDNFSS